MTEYGSWEIDNEGKKGVKDNPEVLSLIDLKSSEEQCGVPTLEGAWNEEGLRGKGPCVRLGHGS